jgi:ADP-heptose:LPS heptosyltransferase
VIQPPSRILLIQLRRFGDVVICTPLAADLRRAFPNARIDFMIGRAAAPLIAHDPNIDDIVLFHPDRMWQMLRQMRRRRYDWIVDAQVHPRTAILALLSGVPVRAGWDARFWGFAYTHRTPRDLEPMYSGRNRQRLLELLGVAPGSPLPRLYLTAEEREQGHADLAELGGDDASPTVGLAIGTHDPERDWTVMGFAAVAIALESAGVRVLIFRFPDDDQLIAAFREETSAGTLVPWRGDRRFLGIVSQCGAIVSANTGPSHIATALGVPRVTLYGSSNSTLWSPGLPTTIALDNPRQRCLGCGRKPCPVNRECIRGITPDEVTNAVRALLAGSAVSPTELPT